MLLNVLAQKPITVKEQILNVKAVNSPVKTVPQGQFAPPVQEITEVETTANAKEASSIPENLTVKVKISIFCLFFF